MTMQVQLVGSGSNDNVFGQIDPSRDALRTSIQPIDWIVAGTMGGHYSIAATSGSTAAIAASGQIFAVRWNDPSKIFVLLRCTISTVCTAFSSGTGADAQLTLAHSYTANSSGGTAISPSSTSQMMRMQTMAPTSFTTLGEIRMITTAALTAGTQTLDTAAIGAVQLGGTAVGNGSGPCDLYNNISFGQHPVVLANNQGFVISAVTAVPASNNFRYSVFMSWMELPSF